MTSHHFFVLAGPQVDYLAAVRERYQPGGFTTSNGTQDPASDNTDTDASYYKCWQVALTGAMGYRFNDWFGLEVRYSEALTDSWRGNPQQRNAGAQLRLSYLLP